jgi:hypothetical protein
MKSSLTLVDSAVIQTRWTEAIGKELPKLTHEMTLKDGNYLIVDIANCKTVSGYDSIDGVFEPTGNHRWKTIPS